ncbi:MAG TPA: BON domain-containing protein [Thermoanaerobaculia bacterium]|nr:BON domain-containing protein [Thermoanaerobaculia bacterium]
MDTNNRASAGRWRRFVDATLIVFCLGTAMPVSAASGEQLLVALRRANLQVTKMTVRTVDGITIIRGQTTVKSEIGRVSRIARDHGHIRIANMIQLVAVTDDDAIKREVERQLSRARALDGCHFTIDAVNGVLTLGGTVQRELQKDAAQDIVTRVPGVRSVIFTVSLKRP